MSVITIDHVSKSFGETKVLRDFTEEFRDGEFITLLGPSGCGKTTMLRMIAGFERPTSGRILIDGEVVSSQDVFVPPEKRGIGMVFQSYAVWPHMNVFDNVAYPLRIRRMDRKLIREKVEKVLRDVHLESFAARMPSQLSGGQQQRVAIARALVAEPEVLLLDEPLSNLDAKLREQMKYEIKELQQRRKMNVLYVTHDQSEAMTMSDRVFIIDAGVVQQSGDPVDIYRHPANRFVAGFIGRINFVSGTAEDGMIRISGAEKTLPCKKDIRGNVTIGIRPENIQIVTPGEEDLEAELISEYFEGDINDCHIRIGDQLLRIQADPDTYGRFAQGARIPVKVEDFHVFTDPVRQVV